MALTVAMLAYLYLFRLELGPRADMPLQIDELFFASCAARGLATGEVPISGCHDNKAPLVYVVYQGLQGAAGLYSLAAFKITAFLLGLANALLTALAVRRYGGRQTALMAAALLLLLYVYDPWFLALKPESIGTALVLAALLLLPQKSAGLQAPRWLCVGLLFGLAVATKQTFVFALAGLVVWLVGRYRTGAVSRLLLLGTGVGAPLAAFAGYFWLVGRFTDFAAALVLYPMLYKSSVVVGLFKGLALRLGALAGFWLPLAPLLLTYLVVLVGYLHRFARIERWQEPAMPYVCVSLGMLVVLLAAPITLRFHLFPAAALAVGTLLICVRRLGWHEQPQLAQMRPFAGGAVVLWAMLIALHAWAGPPGDPLRDRDDLVTARLDTRPGDHAYIVGIWPKLYVDNGLIPASDVLYPTAFPGAPTLWSYQEPPPNSEKARLLGDLHRYNVERLLVDFAATPPRLIVVVEGEGRARGSQRASDIPVFDVYITRNCRHTGEIDIPNHIKAQLYACGR